MEANLNYVDPIPDVSYYGVDEMSDDERTELLEWLESQKSVILDNKREQESCCQDYVSVLRKACQVFRREFLRVTNIEVFLEAVTIASACN